MYHEWDNPHGSPLYVPIYGTPQHEPLSSETDVPPTRHYMSDSTNGLWWEHLLGHNTQPVSDDVPHPQVPLRIKNVELPELQLDKLIFQPVVGTLYSETRCTNVAKGFLTGAISN